MKVIFMGTPALAACALQKLIESEHEVLAVVTQPDKASGRGMTTRFSPVKETALNAGLKIFQPEKIREEEALSQLEALKPELIVVAAYAQLLPKRLLEMAPYGCINIHPSLLPKYRGAAPLLGSILNGDSETGVTIMEMVQELDAGDILLQEKLKMDPKETVRTLTPKAAKLGADMLIRVIDSLEDGTAKSYPQEAGISSYISQLEKEDGKIDFERPAAMIECQIRACDPWPSAYTYLGKKMFKVWDADVVDAPENVPADSKAGTVVYADKKNVCILCGSGCLSLKEVQMEGKKRMGIEEFLRGKKLEKGFVFGE